MGLRRDLPSAVLLAAFPFALLPGAALAAPAWLGPETLESSGSESGAPDVTAFGAGEAAVVWLADGPGADGKGPWSVPAAWAGHYYLARAR